MPGFPTAGLDNKSIKNMLTVLLQSRLNINIQFQAFTLANVKENVIIH